MERFPLAVGWPVALTISLILVALALALRMAIARALPPGFPFLTFFPVVVVSAFLFGSRMGSIVAVLCGLFAWYYFIPPSGFELDQGSSIAMAFYVFITTTEVVIIHWMQRSNRALAVEREANARLARTSELLFRELQHRVSNNLQMVSALLTVQRHQIDDPEAKVALDEASRRLGVVGRISRQLYDPSGAGQSLKPFLEQLTRDIIETSGRGEVRYRVDGDGEAKLSPEAAIPLALIVAEAVANAIEHGFSGREDGEVQIRLARTSDARLSIEVEDNGHGLPAGFVLEGNVSLGLKIAVMLAGQLGGRFTLTPRRGASGALARLELPIVA